MLKRLKNARRPRSLKQVRCLSPESDAMSKDLLSRGFKFVGTKICYSLMQATGMVDEHLAGCWREIKRK